MRARKGLERIIAVEEHVGLPGLLEELPEKALIERGFLSRQKPFGDLKLAGDLNETDQRTKNLDQVGLTMQVLSFPTAGADLLPAREAVTWAKKANEAIAQHIAQHPRHYTGFAHLPLTDPEASADELERTIKDLGFKGGLVNGATGGLYLDHPSFEPLLSRAEALDVPLYLHPSPSPRPVREALYSGLPNDLSFWMSISGWGWHTDTAVHTLRLLLSGAFERHSRLKIVIGHLGEGLQVMLPRLDQQFHQFAGFGGVPSELLRRHVWVSMSGFFFLSSFQAALEAFGEDRLLYSVDYPFGSLERGRAFLEDLPVADDVLAKIAHANADKLLHLA